MALTPAALDSGYLATKRHPPLLPPRLVDRPRLLDALDRAVHDSPVTMLRAPAGSGKTALLTAWARSDRPPGPVAWLSLNHTDGNRGRFWRQVFLALSEAGAGPQLSHLAVPSPEAVERLLVSLVTALAELDSPIVLVLDDLHEVADDQVMSDLAMLLRTPPPSLRLVIGTRRDPPVRLQRMRLAGALSEISAAELVFTEDEALELFAASGLTLDAADTARLWNRTEGWAAGLALTALTLRTRPDASPFIDAFAGDVAPVADYLLEEVLADQPPLMRDFLLSTSVVNVVCGDLADALTGTTGSAVLLERLHHGGVLTTAMDDHREWYRYHGLLADLLRAVLRREEPEMVPILHARAARWYADHDFPVTAARHALDAGDLTFLAEVTATRGAQLLARGEMGELADVLRQVPDETLHANPTFALALASAAIEVGAVADAASWTRIALAHADAVPPQFEVTFRTAATVTRLYQARMAGDVDDALQAARTIITVDDDTPVESGTDLDAIALVNLGALELWTGDQRAATRELRRGAAIAAARSRWYLQAYALSHLAVQALWTGDMPAATRRARRSLALCEEYGWGGTARAGMAKTVLSVVAMLEGRLDDAVVLIEEATVATTGGLELPLRANTELHRGRLLRMRGRTDEALAVVEAVRVDLAGSSFLPPIEGVVQTDLALTLLAAGERERAVALLEESTSAGSSGEAPVALAAIRLDDGDVEGALTLVDPWIGADMGRQMASTQVRALIVAARAQRQTGDREQAFATLERALALAAPQLRRLPFLEQPAGFADQLREQVGGGSAYATFAADLHDRLPRDHELPPAPVVVHPRDELSSRELAVLRFLPTMLTNREIAEELMVSVNTVKTHLKQVYSKLGAHDRRDAVRRARERGLLR